MDAPAMPAPPRDRRRSLLRALVALGAGGFYLVYLLLATVVAFATGSVWGFPAVALTFVVLAGPGVLLAVLLSGRIVPRTIAVVLAGLAILGAGAGSATVAAWTAVPAPVLAAHLDELGVPDGWVLVDEDVDNNGNCLDVCPRTCREYRPTGDVDAAVHTGAEWYGGRGYELRAVNRTNAAYSGRGDSQIIDVESVRRRDRETSTEERLVQVCLEGR